MRITVSHRKTKAEAVAAVDRAVLDVFKGLAAGPLTVAEAQRNWNGSTMTFSLVAKMGFLTNPIRGFVEVTDENITIDADLGLLATFMPQEKVRAVVESRVRGLLA